MERFEALILGLLQGLTEYLPVSSSGHLAIGSALFGIQGEDNLTFTIAVHVATVLSTLVILWKEIDWIFRGLFKCEMNAETKYVLNILVSMIPIGIVGVFFKDYVEEIFGSGLLIVGCMLLVTALLLTFSYYAKPRVKENISMRDAFIIGLAQACAVLPGLSRSGSTIATGLLLGDNKAKLAQFSFLMVIPPILGEALLDGMKIVKGAAAGTTARVERVDVALGHVLCDRSAAACVGLAKLGHLPHDAVAVEQPADAAHDLGRRVGRAALAAGAGVLAQAHAVVDIGRVAALIDLGEVGVVSGGDVGRDAEGVCKAVGQLDGLHSAERLHEVLKRLGLHTGHALGADLFLVGEDAHGGLLRHVQLQNRGQLRIRADAVVMAVGADEAAVKAEVAGVCRRDGLQLGGDKILLHNAVFLMQDAHDGKLHAVGAVVVRLGPAADKDVEGFGRNGLVQRLFALFAAQMGKQVVDDELRVFGVRADLAITPFSGW